MTKAKVRGLYAITNVSSSNEQSVFENVAAALHGGAQFIQYRDKINRSEGRQRIGHRLLMLCREHKAYLIINDDIALCQTIAADGVHLGKDDIDLQSARKQLGEEKIIGISCYNQLQLAVQAQKNGADYIAFGSFFNSSTKPEAVLAPLTLLSEAKACLTLPIVAIGGITVANGKQLVSAGADSLAVINGVFAVKDIESTARKFSDYFL
ncbi:MAG: thiamine phosphate synthase [Gammaproteobacteria bacterium]|nr:thiamine phosphate synthase [Gammaproteobacteria bacterium]